MDTEELVPDGGEAHVDAPELEAEIASPPSVEDLARARGWRPKEEWNGEGEWRDATAFLEFGLDRGRDVSRELKELRETTKRMADTQAEIMRQNVAKAREEERVRLLAVHAQAVDEGDHTKAAQVITRIEQNAKAAPTGDAQVETFMRDNPWFNSDPLAQAVAKQAAEQVAHLPVADQLEAARREVFKRFPEYAPKTQEPAKVVEVANPAATARPVKRGNTFHDLPAEAQQAAQALVRRGLLKNVDGYVKQYFNKEGTIE